MGNLRKMFFFEKKNQKTFICCVLWRRVRDSHSKVFCFFSSEKKTFLSYDIRRPACMHRLRDRCGSRATVV
jgi:hypothetical protein